jgi:hypothetical protein
LFIRVGGFISLRHKSTPFSPAIDKPADVRKRSVIG